MPNTAGMEPTGLDDRSRDAEIEAIKQVAKEDGQWRLVACQNTGVLDS